MPLMVTGERYAYCKNLISLNFVLRQAQHKIKGLGLNRALTSGERPYMSYITLFSMGVASMVGGVKFRGDK